MLKVLLTIFLMLEQNNGKCEAHVYCQDDHATDWTPLGYSCPVNCASVIQAVSKLKKLEYEDWIKENQIYLRPKGVINNTEFNHIVSEGPLDKSEINANILPIDDDDDDIDFTFRKAHSKPEKEPSQLRNDVVLIELTSSHIIELYKIFSDKRMGSDVQRAFKLASKLIREPLNARDNSNVTNNRSRRSMFDKAVNQFTAVLNKYTAKNYFTRHMGKMLLTKVLGHGANLEQGQFEAKQIVKYLRGIIASEKEHARVSNRHMVLKSKFCLNVFVPGCFCIPGFVEQEGQCVVPSDCFADIHSVKRYLNRISIQ